VRGKLNLRRSSLLLPLTHRKLLPKAITLENDLRGTLRNFGLKVGIAGSVKVRGAEQEAGREPVRFGRVDFPLSNLLEFAAPHVSVIGP